jgi:hypothetical protein
MTACKFSLAPFGDPGRVMMTVWFLTPATGRDIMAKGVTASEEASMPWTSPGACLCSKTETASGVWSATAKPVPPVVMTRLTGSAASVQSVIWRWIWAVTSLTILVSTTSHRPPPSFSKTSRSAASAASVEGSLAAVVETTRTAALRGVDMADMAKRMIYSSRWELETKLEISSS